MRSIGHPICLPRASNSSLQVTLWKFGFQILGAAASPSQLQHKPHFPFHLPCRWTELFCSPALLTSWCTHAQLLQRRMSDATLQTLRQGGNNKKKSKRANAMRTAFKPRIHDGKATAWQTKQTSCSNCAGDASVFLNSGIHTSDK